MFFVYTKNTQPAWCFSSVSKTLSLELSSNSCKSQLSADLKANISQKAQEIILDMLDSTTLDGDSAAPLLTAIVKTNATVAENR